MKDQAIAQLTRDLRQALQDPQYREQMSRELWIRANTSSSVGVELLDSSGNSSGWWEGELSADEAGAIYDAACG